MLIYAAADIHGHPRRIRHLRRQIAVHRPDILLLAGDISGFRHPEAMLHELNRLGLPVLLIRGNSDPRHLARLLPSFPRLRSIHLAAARFGDVEIVGIGGTLPLPFHSRLGLKETDAVTRVCTILRAGSVLVAHPPPYGVRDQVLGRFHAGSRAVRRLVDSRSPALVVCGHIHEQAGAAALGDTIVVNCAMGRASDGALIRYDGRSSPVCRMLPPGQ